jgi:hypothetical protein
MADDSVMSATATVPLWIPLATAAAGLIAGLGAGLGAAVWTQHRTDSREDVRWQRERNDRAEQWQRERDDRAEQWRREDSLRWLQDRQQAYARLIAALYEWDSVLLSAIASRHNDLALNTRTKLDAAERIRVSKSAREALPLMQFMAPPAVRSQARRAIRDRESFWIVHLTPDPPDQLKMDAAWKDLIKRTNSLRGAMRNDLGLESEGGDAGQSGG